MNSRTLLLALGLMLACAGVVNAHANQCNPGISCQCVDFVVDNGWQDFDNVGDAKDWYAAAPGKGYATGHSPQVGAVLVWTGDIGAGKGHVAIVTKVISPTEIRIDHANWALNGDMDQQIYRDIGVRDASGENWTRVKTWYDANNNRSTADYGLKDYTTHGFIYPKTSETHTLPTKGDIAWEEGEECSSLHCADRAYEIVDDSRLIEIPKEEALDRTDGICAFPPEDPQEESTEIKRSFWQRVFGAIANAWHDLFGAHPAQACEETMVYRTFARSSDALEDALEVVDPKQTEMVVHTPPLSEIPILNPESHVYPDIRIWSVGFFDGSRELNEGESHINPGGTYRINIYPVSELADARNGTDDDIDHIETDTFVAYGLTEEDLNWKFLCRSYTRTENLTQDDPHKEVCDVTIPEDMGGKRLYVKSKGDATGEVEEDDEGNNWSDEFKEWFPIRGNCNLIISWAGLDEGKTSPMKEGTNYGLKAAVQNIGTTACPGKSRISYELKRPGGSYQQVADDGVDSDQLYPGDTQWEHTMHEPFVADAIGTYGIRVCADSTGANEESNESDNCRETSFDVEMSRSDLIVSDLFLITEGGQTIRNGASIPQDSTVKPYCVAKNIGNRNAKNGVRVSYEVNAGNYRGDDGLDAEDLKIGASKTEYMSDGFRLGDIGNRSYRCCVDYQGQESELNEANNCATMNFSVYPTAPKITITDLWVDYDGKVVRNGGTGKKGKRYHPNVTFTNTGNKGMSCGAEAKYYIDANKYRDRDGIDPLGINHSGHERVDNDDIKLGDGGNRSYRVTIQSNCGEFPTVEKTMSFRLN